MVLPKKVQEARCFVRGRTKAEVEVLRRVGVGVEEEAVSFRYLKMSNLHYGKWECDSVSYLRVVGRMDQKEEEEVAQIVWVVEYLRKIR